MKTKSLSARNRQASGATIELSPVLLKIKTILVPVDFSEPSGKALDYAVSFARQFGAKLTLLYVNEPVASPDFAYFPLMLENDKVAVAARQKLESLCEKRRLDKSVVERQVVRVGRAFHEITEAARKFKADLLIIATHGYTGLKHAFLGSTAERVVRHAPCPVLVVRQHERQFA